MVKKANTGVCDHRAFKISETWLKKTFGDAVHISFSTVIMWKYQGCVNTATYSCQSNTVVVLRLYALYIQIYILRILSKMCYGWSYYQTNLNYIYELTWYSSSVLAAILQKALAQQYVYL